MNLIGVFFPAFFVFGRWTTESLLDDWMIAKCQVTQGTRRNISKKYVAVSDEEKAASSAFLPDYFDVGLRM